jgi:hypothetical protein
MTTHVGKQGDPAAAVNAAAKGRLTVSLPASLVNELRDAVVALSGPPHRLTLTAVVESALRAELARLRDVQIGRSKGKVFPARESEPTTGRQIR